MTDVLVFIVVINLFVQYAPRVIIESFTTSIFTALLLKLMLDSILGLEHRVAAWFGAREGTTWKLLRMATMFSIPFLSKFVIIEVTDLIFGDRVKLGGFIEVVALVIAMIAARRAVTLVFDRLGPPTAARAAKAL